MLNIFLKIQQKLLYSAISQRFFIGATWSLVGAFFSQVIILLGTLLLARIFGKETYGQFVLIQSTVNTVGVFSGFGIGATATRYIAALKEIDPQRLARILALSEITVLIFSAIISLGLSIMSKQMSSSIFNAPELTTPLAIAAFAVFFSVLDGYHKSTLIGFESMRAFAVVSIVGVGLSLPIMLFSVYKFGLYGAVVSLVVSAFLQAIISRVQMTRVLLRSNISKKYNNCLKEWRVIRDYSLPSFLAGALVSSAHWVCQAMLSKMQNGYSEIALLGVAMQWFNVIIFLPLITSRVVMPMLTESFASDNINNSRKILYLAIKANILTAVPMAIFISIISPWLFELYGQDFKKDSFLLIIAAITAAIVAIQTPVGNLISAISRMWLGMIMNFGWAIIYISTSFYLREMGSLGVFIGMGIAYTFNAMWTLQFAFHQLKQSKS
jgi:EPS I polysaccharide export inner membrane protein EpsE